MGVVKGPESTMAREADLVLATHAGPEFGVASTKAFTTQLAVLACVALAVAKARGKLDRAQTARLAEALIQVPAHAAEVLNHDEAIQKLAHDLVEAPDLLHLLPRTPSPIPF